MMFRRPVASRFLIVVIPHGPAPMTQIRGPMVPCVPAFVISRVSGARTCGLLREPTLKVLAEIDVRAILGLVSELVPTRQRGRSRNHKARRDHPTSRP